LGVVYNVWNTIIMPPIYRIY